MRLYFAGNDRNWRKNKFLIDNGAKYRLESYYTLKPRGPSEGFDSLLDSGGFVARTKGIAIKVSDYAEFINKYHVTKAFNLDTDDLAETLENHKYLEKHCKNTKIIPIYHLSDYLHNRELLQQFIADGHDYIGIGGVAGEGSPRKMQHIFYRYIFYTVRTNVKLHGLGITSLPILSMYPWYSVDSTSWLSFEMWGRSRQKNKKVAHFQVKTNHYLENTNSEIKRWVKVEDKITRLWAERGIIWES